VKGTTTLELPRQEGSAGIARLIVTAHGSSLESEQLKNANVIVSELVSNAVTHAAPLPNGRIAVGWTVRDDALHLEITDGGSVTRPQASVAASFSGSGRGLDIVRTICRAWGVTEGERSVTVWADVPMSPMSPVPAPPVAPDG